jgi:hypothetical protein
MGAHDFTTPPGRSLSSQVAGSPGGSTIYNTTLGKKEKRRLSFFGFSDEAFSVENSRVNCLSGTEFSYKSKEHYDHSRKKKRDDDDRLHHTMR